MRYTQGMLMGEDTGGNWSAHAISRWEWITICFVVCCHPSSLRALSTSIGREKIV